MEKDYIDAVTVTVKDELGIKDDFNRNGLISEQGGKKRAFFVMKRWYEGK